MKASLLAALVVIECAISFGQPVIAPLEVQVLLQKDSTVVILDVRTEAEYKGETGHLANAVLIPLQKLEERLKELEPYRSRTIVTYCRSGRRSAQASTLLKENGFHAVNMKGGIVKWNSENLPVIKEFLKESAEEHDARMRWWREARFGLFIHWGLYAIPA
ncbi:MAG TPA: rhodanese-like domain-containing protein, partial [Bacteroidota bacterium]|nr:rhodanese-like domain-containing protein [Bacteroidota bacterium]